MSCRVISLFYTDISAYLKSSEFEADLDQVISYLHIHKPNSKPKFLDFNFHAERVISKSKYVKDQTVLFVVGLGTLGAEIGGSIAGIEGATYGFVIGTVTGIIIVAVVAGSILVKRLSKKEYLALSAT